ncbi:MAG: Smr/MutS family protein, partial [Pseudobdellovibrionaceae bacterium]
SNSMRLQVLWSDLKPPQKPTNPTAQIIRKSGSSVSISLADEDTTLDFRGKTVEEALEQLESALDLALHKKEDRVKIIHGHGTEALKKSIRTYLSRSLYVRKWKAGSQEHGGDGVTWVEIGKD